MDFLNGYKSYLGFVGYGICGALAQFLPEWSELLMQVANYVFAPLAGIGVAHKLAKVA